MNSTSANSNCGLSSCAYQLSGPSPSTGCVVIVPGGEPKPPILYEGPVVTDKVFLPLPHVQVRKLPPSSCRLVSFDFGAPARWKAAATLEGWITVHGLGAPAARAPGAAISRTAAGAQADRIKRRTGPPCRFRSSLLPACERQLQRTRDRGAGGRRQHEPDGEREPAAVAQCLAGACAERHRECQAAGLQVRVDQPAGEHGD